MGTEAGVKESTALGDALRRLWADHVIWTRQYIVAALSAALSWDPAPWCPTIF